MNLIQIIPPRHAQRRADSWVFLDSVKLVIDSNNHRQEAAPTGRPSTQFLGSVSTIQLSALGSVISGNGTHPSHRLLIQELELCSSQSAFWLQTRQISGRGWVLARALASPSAVSHPTWQPLHVSSPFYNYCPISTIKQSNSKT